MCYGLTYIVGRASSGCDFDAMLDSDVGIWTDRLFTEDAKKWRGQEI